MNQTTNEHQEPIIRVSSTSKPSAVAGAIAGMIRSNVKGISVRAIGISAVAKAVYALSLASEYLAKDTEPKTFLTLIHSVEVEAIDREHSGKVRDLTTYEFQIELRES